MVRAYAPQLALMGLLCERVLAERADIVSSEEFAQVLRWATVVAVDAYRQPVLLQMPFDETRRRAVRQCRRRTLER